MTDDEIKTLEELAREATAGPWQNGIDDLEGVVAPHNPGLGNVICIPPLKNMYSSLERWPDNAAFIAAANPVAIRALIEHLRAVEADRDEAQRKSVEAESHRAYYAKVVFRFKDTLLNVTDEMVEEGDRTYFGSTNDADALHAIALKIDDLHLGQLVEHTQPKVNLYDAIEARMIEREAAESRAQAAEERLREVTGERDGLKTKLANVLARDAEWSLSGSKSDCGCIRLSMDAEREYETGTCPHQIARAALTDNSHG